MRLVDATSLSVVALPLVAGVLALVMLVGPGCSSCEDEEQAAEAATDAPSGQEPETAQPAEADAAPLEEPVEEAPAPEEPTGVEEAPAGAAPEDEEAVEPGADVEPEAGAEEGAGAEGALTPLEKRRQEREERIAELKRRNEERRKERLDRLSERYGAGEEGAEAEGAEEEAGAEAEPGTEEAAEEGEEAPGEQAAPQATPEPPALSIARYLNVNDVRRITGDRTLAPAGSLSGIEPSQTYNSAYFAPPVRTKFGASLQVWRERTRRDANERFRRMRRDYPNAEDTTALPPKSFFSWWDGLMTITYADLTKRVVVSVTCSQEICDGDQLLKLAETVKQRL